MNTAKFVATRLVAISLAGYAHSQPVKASHTFAIGTNDFLLDGQKFQIRCGEIHAARVPKAYWRQCLQLGEDGAAENAIDGQTANFWHTEWKNAQPDFPHQLILNLGKSQTISGFRYVPRQGDGGGHIKNYRIFIGDNLIQK